jgi:hypothetical protein
MRTLNLSREASTGLDLDTHVARSCLIHASIVLFCTVCYTSVPGKFFSRGQGGGGRSLGLFYCLILSGTEGIWILLRKGEQSNWVRENGGRRDILG